MLLILLNPSKENGLLVFLGFALPSLVERTTANQRKNKLTKEKKERRKKERKRMGGILKWLHEFRLVLLVLYHSATTIHPFKKLLLVLLAHVRDEEYHLSEGISMNIQRY